MKNSNWSIGKSVVVKAGVADPDKGNDIGGWQGRISATFEDEGIIEIQWDSITLKNVSSEYIA